MAEEQNLPPYLVRITEEIDKNTVLLVNDKIRETKNKNYNKLVLEITSPGGYCYCTLSILELLRSSNLDIVTVNLGEAYSCAGVLLAAGTPGMRFSYPYAKVLAHDISGYNWGSYSEMKNYMEEVEKDRNDILKELDSLTGQKAGFWSKKFEKEPKDFYYNAEKSLKMGFIDHIGVPTITVGTTTVDLRVKV